MSAKINAVMGVDMGATHIRFCLLNSQGKELYCDKRQTSRVISPGLTTGLINTMRQLLERCHATCSRIVMGFPAIVAKETNTVSPAPNLALPAAELQHLAQNLSAGLCCQIQFFRDVNLQLCWDVCQYHLQHQLVLAVYLGSGVGLAIWMNGAPWTGAHGAAGELGHVPITDATQRCACGNPGCLETLCSGVALRHWYQQTARDFPLETVFLHCRHTAFIQQLLEYMARAIATAVNLFDPETVILGGGVMDMHGFPREQLTGLTLQYLRKPLPCNAVKFVTATSSDYNGARGAAKLAWMGHDAQ